ncbi:MAG: MACPF domain-containing protein [Cytophagales bacterium]|nr:MACPF domain-containing protein [Cytophagales bacterium]
MKKTGIIFTALLMLFITSCVKDFQEGIKENPNSQIQNEKIVLKERDPNSPLVLSQRTTKNKTSSRISENASFKSFLGNSIKLDELPLTDYKNFGWSVIDIDNYLEDYPNSYNNPGIGTTSNNSFAYTSFEKYVEKSGVTEKIKGGFDLNLGVFKVAAKSSMEKTFSTTNIIESNRVFGEMYYQYMGSRYLLKNSSNDIKIMKSYVSQSFKDDLYNIPPGELFELYGGFVLSDFIVGGKATALYSGVYQGNESSETRENKMQNDIEASFGEKASGDFGFGTEYSSGKELSNKFTDLKTSIKTLGGVGAIIDFMNPEEVSSIKLNLTTWLSSLNDTNNHSIIDISDNGLLPITEFVREDNLKEPLIKMLNNGHPMSTKLYEPILVYGYINELDTEVICLVTRYADPIVLYENTYINSANTNAIIDQYSSMYKTKLVDMSEDYSLGYELTADLYSAVHIYHGGFIPLHTIGDEMRKFVHNNTTYLISQKSGIKFAFSIHDDYIFDTYAIREWVNNMQSTQLTPSQLDEYTIVAL